MQVNHSQNAGLLIFLFKYDIILQVLATFLEYSVYI